MIRFSKKNRPRWVVPLFFLTVLLMGLGLVDDYGMSWDEAVQRKHGFVALDYVADVMGWNWQRVYPQDNLEEYVGRHYTLIYSMFCGLLEKSLGLETDFRGRYLLRHVVVFVLFWASLMALYKVLLLRFKDWKMGLIGVTMVLLSPRIFANAFYNPKDMILFAFFSINILTCLLFFLKGNFLIVLLHGFVTGLAINTRFTALYIPAFTIFLVLLDLIQNRFGKATAKRYLQMVPVYLIVSLITTILFFPYVWEDTFVRLQEAYLVMANFPWGSHNLYFSQFIAGNETPWHYIPVWIGITTPVFYLLLFATGLLIILFQLSSCLRKRWFWRSDEQFIDLAALGLCGGPLLIVILLNSTLYNGWRHLYFIYPAFMLIAMTAVFKVVRGAGLPMRRILFILLLLSFAKTAFFMVTAHPKQQVYFNEILQKDLAYRFDMDYWGLAYKQAFEELARRTGDEKSRVKCANYPCEDNFRFLPEKVRSKLELVWEIDEADYYLSNFRRPEEHDQFVKGTYPYQELFFDIKSQGNPVIGVYKLK